MAPGAQAVAAEVQHDLMQPGGESRRARPPVGGLLPGAHEGILTDLVGIRAIVEQSSGQRVQPIEVTLQQHAAAAGIAAAYAFEGVEVGIITAAHAGFVLVR